MVAQSLDIIFSVPILVARGSCRSCQVVGPLEQYVYKIKLMRWMLCTELLLP